MTASEGKFRATIERRKPNKRGYELPVKLTTKIFVPGVIAYVFFKWKLHPLAPGTHRLVNVQCTRYKYYQDHEWPVLSTNLEKSWIKAHHVACREIKAEGKASGLLPDETASLLPGMGAIDISTQDIDAYLSREGAAQITLTKELQAIHAIFDLDPKTYKAVLLEYLIENSLPFAHVDSPSLSKLLSYIRRCEGEPSSETRHSMRAGFD